MVLLMKKRTAFFIIMIFLFASVNICVFADGELTITSNRFKTGQAYSAYSDFVRVSGGEGSYTYTCGTLPRGLSLNSETGEISGIPTVSSQVRNIPFTVKDAAGNSVTKRITMNINPRLVDFNISNYNYIYEKGGAPYKATLESRVAGINFNVYYGKASERQTEVNNAGLYPINISMDSGYRVGSVFDTDNVSHSLSYYTLNVYQNQNASISVEDANYIYETGGKYEANVTVVPSDISYEVTYRKQGETEYTSEVPTEVGMYSVLARTTDSNYAERQATGVITVGYQTVQFNSEAADSYTYNGNPQSPNVTAVGEIPEDAWQVTYRNTANDEVTNTAPTNAGTYEIIIDFKGNPYEAEISGPTTFTIDPMPVDFNMTSEHTVIQVNNNFNVTATPIDNTLITTDDYYVYIVDLEGHEFSIDVPRVNTGEFRSRVRVTNPNFALGNANELVLTVAGGCNFNVVTENSDIKYGESFNITVEAKNTVLHDYSVSLTDDKNVSYKLTEIADPDGDHTTHDGITHWTNSAPLDVGTYTVIIEHDDSEHNFIGDVTGDTTLTVGALEVNFEVTSDPEAIAENSGDKFTFDVTPSTDLIKPEDYTVVIKDESNGEHAADSTDLTFGNYTADITINSGVTNFTKGAVTSNTFRVARGLVNLTVTADPAEITYGNTFNLSVTANPKIDYKITLLDAEGKPHELTEMLNAGDYSIKAEVLDTNYAIGTVTAPALKVNPLPITFEVTGDNVEEGSAFAITAAPSSPLVDNDDYIIELINPDNHDDVHQINEILPIGEYSTRITVKNDNFTYDGSSEKILYVLKKTIDFTITADPSEITYGETFNPTITPSSEVTGYTVSLVDKDGGKHSVSETLDVGEYTVAIEYDGEDYEVGACTELTLKVNPAPITFTVTGDTEFDYAQGVKRTVDVTNEAGIGAEGYTVQYKLNGALSADAELPGEYEIVVTIINNPNYIAAPITEKLIIHDPTIMNMGNSPAAMILRYGGENAEQLLTQFGENHTIGAELNGITDERVYNDIIWNDRVNLDLDPYAVFVRKFTEFQDPGLTYTTDGSETVTVYGEIEGSDSINPKERAVYNVTYRYGDIVKTRRLVVLGSKTADANSDRYVNSIDANVIYTLIGTEPETMAEKILYYRICDLNQDGTLTQEDVNMITNRFETPINEYYPWVLK